MTATRLKSCVGLLLLLNSGLTLAAQEAVPLLKQDKDNLPAISLTAAELASLGDPFFDLVLRTKPNVVNLSDVEQLLQPAATDRLTFVVDENIADAARGQHRRAVLAFKGQNGGRLLSGNVMLSVGFTSEEFSDTPRFIEAWGWDNERGRYNYYKLDHTGTPTNRLTWKFRGSSVDADLLSSSDRNNSCMQCHINGAPMMKELLFPWNNWHSVASRVEYLTADGAAGMKWPVATSPRLAGGRLKGAEDLERMLLPALTQFNTRRLNAQLERSDADGNIALRDGHATVINGRRLLRPLFVATEFNTISARQKSGLHPLPEPNLTGPQQDVEIPSSFFLNANVIGGSTVAKYLGLGLTQSQSFGAFARVRGPEYRKLVVDAQLELAGSRPADADFAWYVPEPSHIDNDMIDRLLRRGVVTPEFVAAVLSVDLERPVVSAARERLLQFVPQRFSFRPLDGGATLNGRHPDDLTRATITAIRETNVRAGTPEGEFLAALQHPEPIKLLAERVDEYLERVKTALADAQERPKELVRLFNLMMEAREAVLQHETLGALDETGGDRLFPKRRHALRRIGGSGGQVNP